MAMIVSNNRNQMIPSPFHLRTPTMLNVARLLYDHRAGLWGKFSNLVNWFSPGSGQKKKGNAKQHRPASLDRMTHTSSANVVSMDTTLRTPTYWHQSSVPQNEGMPGDAIRIIGRQYVAAGQTGVADVNFFGGAFFYLLSPDTIGGRLALIARTYGKYAFRHVRMIYITSAPTSVFGSFALSFANDPLFKDYATVTFQTSFQMDPSVISTVRTDSSLEINYSGDETYFTETDSATSAGYRQTLQGAFYCLADQILGGSLYGYWMIEYCCDLYQPVADLGFTLLRHLRSKAEKDAVDAFIQDLRRRNHQDDDTDSQHSTVLIGRNLSTNPRR